VTGRLLAVAFFAAVAVRADGPPAFSPDSPVVNITKANYEAEVLRSTIPVLLDYYNDHCPPCRLSVPRLEWIARAWPGKLKVARIEVEQQPELDRAAGISVVPTYFYVRGGRAVKIEIENTVDVKGRETVRFVPSSK
jgi:thioredoxin 1